MSRHIARSRGRAAAVLVAGAAVLAAAGLWVAAGTASAGTLSGTLVPRPLLGRRPLGRRQPQRLPYRRSSATRSPASPQARWFANFNPSTVQSEASAFIGAANAAGQIPVLSVYEITNRDCGGASAGGAPDLGQYQTLGVQLRARPGQPDRHRHPGDRLARPADLPERAATSRARNQAHHDRHPDHQVGQPQRQGVPRRRPLDLEQRQRAGQPAARGRRAVRRRLLHQRVELQLDLQRGQLRPGRHLRAQRHGHLRQAPGHRHQPQRRGQR